MPRGRLDVQLYFFFNRGTRREWVVSPTPRVALPPRKTIGTHFIGGWVGPRPGLDGCGKSCLPPRFDPRTVQALASRYTSTLFRPTRGRCIHIKYSKHRFKYVPLTVRTTYCRLLSVLVSKLYVG